MDVEDFRDFRDLFLAKYYIGIYSQTNNLELEKMQYICNTIKNYNTSDLYQSAKYKNLFHTAFILGILDSMQSHNTTNNREMYMFLLKFYLDKINYKDIPIEFSIPKW